MRRVVASVMAEASGKLAQMIADAAAQGSRRLDFPDIEPQTMLDLIDYVESGNYYPVPTLFSPGPPGWPDFDKRITAAMSQAEPEDDDFPLSRGFSLAELVTPNQLINSCQRGIRDRLHAYVEHYTGVDSDLIAHQLHTNLKFLLFFPQPMRVKPILLRHAHLHALAIKLGMNQLSLVSYFALKFSLCNMYMWPNIAQVTYMTMWEVIQKYVENLDCKVLVGLATEWMALWSAISSKIPYDGHYPP